MQFVGGMKRLVVFFVAALCVSVGAYGHARPTRANGTLDKTKKPTKKQRHRRRARMPSRSLSPLAAQHDEIVLSPALLRQLQHNLIDAGYLHGTADGRLTLRTRRALAEFQHEYHLTGTGSLDRPTAEALLGRDTIGAYTIAAAAH